MILEIVCLAAMGVAALIAGAALCCSREAKPSRPSIFEPRGYSVYAPSTGEPTQAWRDAVKRLDEDKYV